MEVLTIKTIESGATMRTRLSKSIVLALRTLMGQGEPTELSLDLVAFIVLALEKIAESVNQSAQAWEKRDYWLKADQFRMEWAWAERICEVLCPAVLARDWTKIIPELTKLAQPLGKIKVSASHRLGEPWIGAWQTLVQNQKS